MRRSPARPIDFSSRTISRERAAPSSPTRSVGFHFNGISDGATRSASCIPMLDSLGLEPILREVYVTGRKSVRADLGIPSPTRLRAPICAERADSGGVIVGFVRDERRLLAPLGRSRHIAFPRH